MKKLLLLMLISYSIFAIPAKRTPTLVKQPDGNTFYLIGFGDERYSFAETIDGYVVIQGLDKFWYYAVLDVQGKFIPSGAKVYSDNGSSRIQGNFNLQKHLRESQSVISTKMQSSGMEPNIPVQLIDKSNIGLKKTQSNNATTRRELILCVKYSDLPSTFTSQSFQDMVIDDNWKGGIGGLNKYFKEVSYNNLTVQADYQDWIVADSGYAYYGKGNPNYSAHVGELVKKCLAAAEANGVNFANYDNDGDGVVDGVFIVHAGPGAEEGSNLDYIWSHKGSISSPPTYDGKTFNYYIALPETYNSGHVDIGVICHEYGHMIGLPDTYDVDYATNGESEGLGNWDLMAGGAWGGNGSTPERPVHISAYCKALLGYTTPTLVSTTQAITIPNAEQNSSSFKIWMDSKQSDEYMLIENRQKTGFDLNLPGSGLLIYHVDKNLTDIWPASNNINITNTHIGIKLYEADGLEQMATAVNRGNPGDPYPGSTNKNSLTGLTTPNTKLWDNSSSGVEINNISASSTSMTATAVVPTYNGYDQQFFRKVTGLGYSNSYRFGMVKCIPSQTGKLIGVRVYSPANKYTNLAATAFTSFAANTLSNQVGNTVAAASATVDNFVQLNFSPAIDVTQNVPIYVRVLFQTAAGSLLPVDNTAPITGNSYRSSSSGDLVGTSFTLMANYDLPVRAVFQSGIPIPITTPATNIATTNFTANWNASTDATGYYLDVATNNFPAAPAVTNYVNGYNNLSVGNVLTYSVTGLSTSTTYYYRVRSITAGGTSDNSNIQTVTTIAPAPTALSATGITGTSFISNWSAFAGATGYSLDVATNNFPAAPAVTNYVNGYNDLAVGNVLNYSVSGLSTNTVYYYRVRAITAGGTSGNSNTQTLTTGGAVPLIVTGPANYDVGVSILPSFTWTSNGFGTGFEFQLDSNSSFSSSPLLASGTGNGYSFTYTSTASTVLANNTIYYWRIRSTNGGTNVSDWVTRQFTTAIATTPYISGLAPLNTSCLVYWNTSPYSTGIKYDLYYSINSDMSGASIVSDLISTYTTLSNLTPGATYYIQVRTKNLAGSVIYSYSSISNFTIQGLPVPTPSYPTGGVTVYLNPASVYWYIGSYIPGLEYIVRYSTSNTDANADGMLDTGTDLPATTNLYTTLPNLVGAGPFYWQVKAKSGAVSSAWSTVQSFTMYTSAPMAPVIPLLSWPTGGNIVYTNPTSLYWYLGTYSTGLEFYFEYDDTPNCSSPLGNSGWISNLNYTIPGNLNAGVTYYWRVKSRVASTLVESSFSSIESFVMSSALNFVSVPFPIEPFGTVNLLKPTLKWFAYSASTLEYQLRWSPFPDVDVNGKLNNAAVDSVSFTELGSSTAYTFPTNLTAGATYYWQVRARIQSTPEATSSWSYVNSFTTAAGALSVVPLIGSPNFGQPINNTTAVLSWVLPTNSDSQLKYDVQYSRNKDLSNPIIVTDIDKPSASVTGLQSNSTYYWRALSKTSNGSISEYSAVGSFRTNGTTDIFDLILPTEFSLDQNYPNPFNPTTIIHYALPTSSFVTLKVYDMLGREVKTLVNEEIAAGRNSVQWNGDDNFGRKVSTGIYVYRITANNFVSSKKMLLIK